jgi:hypothetical protein
MNGTGLIRVLIAATGLPEESITRELNRLFAARGLDPDQITLDDVREVLATYLQDTLVEAKTSLAEP